MSEADTIIAPQSEPQRKFLSSEADIAIYGGAAGGGKSWAIVIDPLRYVHVPGFKAALFRRTTEEIRGSDGLWEESCKYYPALGAKGREQMLDWRWPNGATIRFEHLQHESTKFEYQGAQFCELGFDELTHFTETQFFYMLSRNRSTCGVKPYVRATCNPDVKSWVAGYISWWIDQDSGFPIKDRSGVIRWFCRPHETIEWADTREELIARFPGQEIDPRSVTFIPAKLSDNLELMRKDPGYRARLLSLPRVDRERLLGGNWKISDSSIIDIASIRHYTMSGDYMRINLAGKDLLISPSSCRRFATIDTAGTSREMAEEKKGKPPSWSVCAIWDYDHKENVLLLRHVWRDRVGWLDLKTRIPEVLATWRVTKAYIENAHHGQPLKSELRGVSTELIGPVIDGMVERGRGAKYERAVASGFISRIEDGRLFIPAGELPWIRAYTNELVGWGGLPDETADQIDVSSYACFTTKRLVASWGGVVKSRGLQRV